MELRQLRVFVAIAEEGTFTAASDRLMLVQSAVSATIRALERELGTPLFERTTRRVELTDAGQVLLPEARAILEASRLAVDAVDQVKGGVRGTVSIGIMQATASQAVSVPRLIAGFQAEHPLVTVTVRHVGGSASIAAHVRDGELDLGILSLPGELAGLELTELGREPMMLACAPEHPLAQRDRVSLGELRRRAVCGRPARLGSSHRRPTRPSHCRRTAGHCDSRSMTLRASCSSWPRASRWRCCRHRSRAVCPPCA